MRFRFLLSIGLFLASQSYAQLSFLSKFTYSTDLSDVWGYVDESGNEYALVGRHDGVSIVNVTNPLLPVEVFSTPGQVSIWRDLKTWGDYAYITNETGGGLMIIDLSPLPQSTLLTVTNFTVGGLNSAHNLYIDENGVCYIFGSNLGSGGVRMYDLAANPVNPPLLGTFENWYVHDGMARGDTLYLAHINQGFFTIVNVANKSNPVVMGSHNTPHNFTHNVWVSDDGNYLYTTDEVSGAFLGAYDISDVNNISEVDRVQSSPGSGVIPHNAHFINGFLVTSYYRDGVTLHDVNKPDNVVEIGRYDSSPLAGSGFNGSWGAYPWLPSGNILNTDIEEGLFVIGVNYKRASYLEGIVTDSICGTPIQNASISVTSIGMSTISNINGEYKTGTPHDGVYNVTITAPGYTAKTISGVTLSPGVVTQLNVELNNPTAVGLTGNTHSGATANTIPGVTIQLNSSTVNYTLVSDTAGDFARCNVNQANYNLFAGKWGYITQCFPLQISGSVIDVPVDLPAGIHDDFTFDFGWTVTGNASSGNWVRAIPIGTFFNGQPSNPGSDVLPDCSNRAFVTGNSTGAAGDDDVDNGVTILTSPSFDLSQIADPWISYYRWFYNDGGSGSPNDTFTVTISNGITTAVVEKVTAGSGPMSTWLHHRFRVSDFITPTANMTVSFAVADESPGHIVEAGIDKFEAGGPNVSVEERSPLVAKVYPNPSTGSFTLVSPEDGQLQIISMDGKLVYDGVVNAGNNPIEKQFAGGMYLLRIVSEETHTLKLIITE